jgi:hypothetical protein
MRRHQYFDKHGQPISAAAALDSDSLLRDGCSLRVPTMFRDSAASTTHAITDTTNGADPTAGNRAGFRVAAIDAAARDAREAAYQQYEGELVNAWKGPHRR